MDETEFSDEEEEEEYDNLPDVCASNFSLLEADYRNIIAKLQENEDLTEFLDAYTKLFEVFYETYNNEQILILNKADLEEQLNVANETITSYKELTADDANTIKELKLELAHSRKLADDAHSREQQTQEIIENMRNQILKLNNELELKSRLGGDDDDQGEIEMNKTMEGYEREKQRMIDEITSLKQKLTNALSYSEELEHKNSAANLKASELNTLLEQQTNESSKKQRSIEKLESDLHELNKELEQTAKNYEDAMDSLENNQKQIAYTEMQLRDQRTATEKAFKNNEILELKLEKCYNELEATNLELANLNERFSDLQKSYRLKNDECSQLRNDFSKINKQKDALEKKLQLAEKFKFTTEQERDKLRTNIMVIEREVALITRENEKNRKEIESLTKDKELLHKNYMRLQGAIDGHMKLIKIQEQSKRKLEGDIYNYNQELVSHRKVITKMEKDRNKAIEESLDLQQKVEDAMDDIKMKQQSIYDLKKNIVELETKLRQQQNLFEAVRADRNSFQKQVQDVTNEIVELKAKLKISIHQSHQLKEDIAFKEALFVKQETVLRKMNKEKENLKIEVQNGLNEIQKLKHEIEELTQSEKLLAKTIQENEAVIKKQKKQYEEIVNDRDVLGAQMVRRNDEIHFATEQLRVFRSILNRGEAQYQQRIEDVKLLKLEVKRVRQERNSLSKSIANMTDLKHEVFILERELAQERLKCRALEEELQHPMNIHRWRKLEGSDPQVVDLLQKVQILHRRLLNATADSLNKDKQLKESEKLYIGLRQVLLRQPAPTIKEEFIKAQRALTLRGKKMKCLISEINMYETQSVEYQMDINNIKEELRDIKEKYLKTKKLCTNLQKQISHKHGLSEIHQQHEVGEDNFDGTAEGESQPTKFAGGGFKFSS